MAVEGRTQREIAEETGRNLRTVNKTIRTATKQIAEYKAAEYWEILGKYHNSLEAIAERARDEYILDENGISSRKVESDEELAKLRKELLPRDENREDDDKTAGVID